MKKYIFPLATLLLLLASATSAYGQSDLRQRLQQQAAKEKSSEVNMSVRALQAGRTSRNPVDNAKWSRTIYRYIDLNQADNAVLYYPVLPEEGRMNLFTLIFKLMAEDKIEAYEYLDGRELFTDEYLIDFEEFLQRFSVYYQTDNNTLVVDDIDIPSNEVQGYFIKEIHYFETGTSNLGVQTVALCPIIHRQEDYSAESARYPLFWIPYEQLMPYTMRMPIMTSNLNNTMLGTIDDFFRKGDYKGEIFKTGNALNQALSQQTNSPEELANEQEKIEQQLIDFKSNLWRTDSTTTTPHKKKGVFKRSKKSKPATSSGHSMRDRRY